MSDGLNPTGPSQPSIDQAYETSGNPTQKAPAEASRARINANADDDDAVDHRSGSSEASYDQATATSMARGVRGAPPGEETKGYTQKDMDSQELDAEQMGAPGEGRVASAVGNPSGAAGSEQGLECDLDRKKKEQAPARKSIQEEKQKDVDVGGVLGQRGGPANPVDKGNYPNSGD